MDNKFVPGTKVIATWDQPKWQNGTIIKYRHDEYGDFTLEGLVVDKEAPDGKVYVKWDEDYGNADIDYDEPQEIEVKLLTLFSDLTKIEEEFNALRDELGNKMKEASDIIKEAGKLAKKHGYVLADIAGSDLYSAMNGAGWNTSSWGC